MSARPRRMDDMMRNSSLISSSEASSGSLWRASITAYLSVIISILPFPLAQRKRSEIAMSEIANSSQTTANPKFQRL